MESETTHVVGRIAVVRNVKRDNPEIVKKTTARLTLISAKEKT